MTERIGSLRERVTLQSETRNPDAAGGAVVSWSALAHAPTVWARVEPLLGREALQAMQLKAPVSYRVTMRWRDDITAAMRLVWGARVLNIRSIINPDERRRYIEILCEEGVAT
jgi:SPP1 family predicted phage head-tail adaptor